MRERLARNALEFVERQCSLDVMLGRYAAIYSATVERRRLLRQLHS
jgi:hypothetical protein